MARGCFDWLDGRHEKARNAWLECLSLAEAAGLPYEIGLAHFELGRHLSDGETLPDGSGRVDHLQRAAQVFSDLGAGSDLKCVNSELHRAHI